MNGYLKPHDYIAAAMSPILSLSLAEINSLVGIIGGATGFMYLLWRWRREAKRRDSRAPFEPQE